MGQMGWIGSRCFLAGSSKTAHAILIFSIAMSADYSIELISIEIYVPQFIGHNKIFLGSVIAGWIKVPPHFIVHWVIEIFQFSTGL